MSEAYIRQASVVVAFASTFAHYLLDESPDEHLLREAANQLTEALRQLEVL